VERLWLWSRAVLLAIPFLGTTPRCCFAQSPTATPNSTSWTDSITSPVKQGFSKVGQAFSPKPSHATTLPDDDAVSLNNKAKPGADLFVAIAHLYEQSGKLAEAEQQYQLALSEDRNHLKALLGYAHLKEVREKPNDAIQLYQRAAKAYPKEASVHNNLGLCYARQGKLDEAVTAMTVAIQLEPKNPLYRNNIATVLVDQNKAREAFAQLREVHGNAAAYYNMGYLLNKKGQTQAALQNFTMAVRADPSMVTARRWVEYLQRSTAQARLSQHPASVGVKVTTEPTTRLEDMLLPPEEPAPRRLPPTTSRPPVSDGPSLPGINYNERSAAPAAPMPPSSTNAAIRPLPRVR
jgi:tetratricopeptide (TPR) repeat protein